MFNKLFKAFSNKGKDEPTIDLSLGYERLNEFKDLLSRGEYKTFEEQYDQLTWDARTLLNEGIGLDYACADTIDKWVEEKPDSYVAQLFAAVSCTNLAWIARTAAAGADVSEARAEKFFEWLEKASEHLKAADELNPNDAEICARTIRVYMGLGIEKETVQAFFDAAIQIEPSHLMTHLMMINYLNPKWRGSMEEMYEFAKSRFAETDNSLLVVLVLFAITEEWKYYDMTDDIENRDSFFNNVELKSKIKQMYADYQESEDGKLLIPYVYNYFAFLFYQFDEKKLAREVIRKINGKMTVYPWAYLGVENNKQLESL
jgi:hypothetical protein